MKQKYTYSVSGNTVYCITYYAGKTIRGIAKCDPEDNFNIEDGMLLAKARCDYKLAKKRVTVKGKRVNLAVEEFERANTHMENAIAYYKEATDAEEKAKHNLEQIIAKLS